MADLLGDPEWPQLHTTHLHFVPDVATPQCRSGVSLDDAASLRGLLHLGMLSISGCFGTAEAAAVELPPTLFAAASSSLEQIVVKSNPTEARTGEIPGVHTASLARCPARRPRALRRAAKEDPTANVLESIFRPQFGLVWAQKH